MKVNVVIEYLDGGTGSYIFALIAGGGAGVWLALRTLLARLTQRGKSPKEMSEPSPEVD